MRILVSYYSETGNTQAIAEAVRDELVSLGHDAAFERINDLGTGGLNGYDMVFVGSACHSSDVARPVKAALAALQPTAGLKLAGFVTHSTTLPDGGARARELYETWAAASPKTFERVCREKGITWCGYFSCQGKPSAPIEAMIEREILTDPAEWQTYVAEVRQHPNEADKAKARAWARAMVTA